MIDHDSGIDLKRISRIGGDIQCRNDVTDFQVSPEQEAADFAMPIACRFPEHRPDGVG